MVVTLCNELLFNLQPNDFKYIQSCFRHVLKICM